MSQAISNGQNPYPKTSSFPSSSLHSFPLSFHPYHKPLTRKKDKALARTAARSLFSLISGLSYRKFHYHHVLLESDNVDVLKTISFRHLFTIFLLFSQPFSASYSHFIQQQHPKILFCNPNSLWSP